MVGIVPPSHEDLGAFLCNFCCCKVISAQTTLEEDVWDMEYENGKLPTTGIPMGSISKSRVSGHKKVACPFIIIYGVVINRTFPIKII